MAKYRQVHTTFWDDGFVIDLTPEEKYFYLYLMTNNNTTQCGIYELPYRVIEMHTGYNRDTVLKLLDRFNEYGKINYNVSTKEIMLVNWAKYNFINSPKVKKCIEKELQLIKHKPFVNMYLNSLSENGYHIDTVSISSDELSATKVSETSNDEGSIPYQYPMDSPCIDLGEEEEKEKEQEEEEEKEQQQEKESASPSSQVVAVVNPFNFYAENGFGLTMNDITRQKILAWCDDLSDELVVHAMQIAIERNCVSWSYAEGILKKWHSKGVKSLQDVDALVAQFEAQQSRKNHSFGSQRTENVPDWFDKRKQEKQQKPPVNNEPIDFEAERAKVLAKLGGASNA